MRLRDPITILTHVTRNTPDLGTALITSRAAIYLMYGEDLYFHVFRKNIESSVESYFDALDRQKQL